MNAFREEVLMKYKSRLERLRLELFSRDVRLGDGLRNSAS